MLSLTYPTAKAATMVINGSHSISSPKIVSIGNMNCNRFGLAQHRSIVISNAHKRFNFGRTQATADDLAQSAKNTADAVIQKATEAAQSAKDAIEQKQKEGKASTDDLGKSAKDAANSAKDKTGEAVESTKAAAQQTGEQAADIAQNASDSAKKSLD